MAMMEALTLPVRVTVPSVGWEYKETNSYYERDCLGDQGWEAYAVTQDTPDASSFAPYVWHMRKATVIDE